MGPRLALLFFAAYFQAANEIYQIWSVFIFIPTFFFTSIIKKLKLTNIYH